MKKLFFPFLIATVGLLAFTPSRNNSLPIGSALPKGEVKLKDVSGKSVSLNDVKMKNGLLVIFSCNTCPYVVKYQSRCREVCSYAQNQKIGVIVVNSNESQRANEDSYAAMQTYAKAQQYKWYYAVDNNSELANAFDAGHTPECFLFNSSGKLVYHGGIDDNPSDEKAVTHQHLKEAIKEMMAGKDVSVKESRSIGCSIKRKA
jgi:hypothetical protein